MTELATEGGEDDEGRRERWTSTFFEGGGGSRVKKVREEGRRGEGLPEIKEARVQPMAPVPRISTWRRGDRDEEDVERRRKSI